MLDASCIQCLKLLQQFFLAETTADGKSERLRQKNEQNKKETAPSALQKDFCGANMALNRKNEKKASS